VVVVDVVVVVVLVEVVLVVDVVVDVVVVVVVVLVVEVVVVLVVLELVVVRQSGRGYQLKGELGTSERKGTTTTCASLIVGAQVSVAQV
jgi:hypothetical protein